MGDECFLVFFFTWEWVSVFFLFLQDVHACLNTCASKICCLSNLHFNSCFLFMIKIRAEGRSLTVCAFMSSRYKTLKTNQKKITIISQRCHSVRSSASFMCWSPDSWCFVFLIFGLETHICSFVDFRNYRSIDMWPPLLEMRN